MAPIQASPDRSDVNESSYLQVSTTVGTSAVEVKVGGSRLSTRQIAFMYNDSDKVMYWGPSGVTASGSTRGVPLEPGQMVNLPFGDVGVFVIGVKAGQGVIFGEVG